MHKEKRIWLGANSLESTWSWDDGERVSYANWAPGKTKSFKYQRFFFSDQPQEEVHCLSMDVHTGKWESTACFLNLPYICEMGVP